MNHGLSFLLTNTLLIVAALLPIVNPVGQAPIFISLTRGESRSIRNLLARKVAINGFALLLASMFIGTYVLKFFGISLPIVRVGGGLLVMSTAWQMLHSDDSGKDPVDEDRLRGPHIQKKAFFPLTFPLTVGPGTVSIAITLGANVPSRGIEEMFRVVAGVTGAGILALAIFASYRFADKLVALLGETGTVIFLRLSSFSLLCIGIQILWDGVSELVPTLMAAHS